jgi:hypothetical protein
MLCTLVVRTIFHRPVQKLLLHKLTSPSAWLNALMRAIGREMIFDKPRNYQTEVQLHELKVDGRHNATYLPNQAKECPRGALEAANLSWAVHDAPLKDFRQIDGGHGLK